MALGQRLANLAQLTPKRPGLSNPESGTILAKPGQCKLAILWRKVRRSRWRAAWNWPLGLSADFL